MIPTDFGQNLSWEYYLYAKQNLILKWNSDTKVLYGIKDNLTERSAINEFAEQFHSTLTVMENGERWFHNGE